MHIRVRLWQSTAELLLIGMPCSDNSYTQMY
uniref:Uncharacterized protein n=1 Tax=Arundo donax TaxID=35708 RepID=A0A0A8ZXS6_ARUDO